MSDMSLATLLLFSAQSVEA